jgi:ABC-type multidrug transport system fused ATPase/permease subunit
MGLESIAGEGGSSLSGGQRQRISIARALLKNAPIICMDEPTSALDVKSEKLIQDSIGSLIKDKTVLLVTHRLPLLSLMDKIYVLDNGQLVDVEKYGGIEKYTYQLHAAGQL